MWAKSYVFFIQFICHSYVRLDPWHGITFVQFSSRAHVLLAQILDVKHEINFKWPNKVLLTLQ